MDKASTTSKTRKPGSGVARSATVSQKMVYADALRRQDRKELQEVQLALEKGQAGRLLFGKV